jgi:CTP:molybdopterin cytidylyltransferase MocA
MPEHSIFALVLAAGEGSRFGATKQLSELDGETLASRAMRLAEEVCGECSVLVIGSNWHEVLAACGPMRGFFVINEDFSSGIAGSIASGVNAVAHCADAVLLLLADQPLIGAAYLRSVIAEWQRTPGEIIISEYSGIQGPPVIFPASCFEDLAALRGDQGARAVVASGKYTVRGLKCDAASVDIDSQEDLAKLKSTK